MEMGADSTCIADYIEIFDGLWTSSRSFGRKCTSWQTLTLSTTNYMLVVFKSSGIGRFLATYTNLGKRITLSEPQGFISSPGYPLGYLNNMFYTWSIEGDADTYIVLDITGFELENSCYYDYLKIYDGSTKTSLLYGSFCSSSLTGLMASTSTYMYIEFKTDSSMTYKGFYGKYQIIDKSTFIYATFGSIVSPGYPFGILNNATYYWTILGEAGTSVHLNITSFELKETFSSCTYNTVQIYDGSNDSSLTLSQLCGNIKPLTIVSTSSSMFIVFRSDVANIKTGFNATFYSQDLPYRKSCYRLDQCRSNLICVGAYCDCPSDTYYNISTSTCYPALDHYLECNDTVTAMCKSSKYLYCLPDVNRNARCLCMDTFYFVNNTCVSTANFFMQRPQAKNKNTTGVELQWEASIRVSNILYSVSWVSTSNETDKGKLSTNESGVTVTGLTPGTSYTITVYTFIQPLEFYTAKNISTVVNIVTYPAQPGQVNITASKLDKPPYIIRFQPSKGRVDNYIFILESKLQLLNITVTFPEVNITYLEADTDYKYNIKAVNYVGDESAVVEGSFKTESSEVSAQPDIGMITGATVGSLVFVVLLLIVSIVIYGRILPWKAKTRQNTRNREEQPDSKIENEEDYDPDETINQLCVDVDHYDRYNVVRGINPEYGLVNSPPLPPRPQPNQYIDLRLVPIRNTENSLKDMSIDLMNTGVTKDIQEEYNAENSDETANIFLRLIDTSDVDCTDEFESSELKIDSVNQTEECNENEDEISGETESTLIVKPYDSLMPRIARTEENKYFSCTDDLHKNTNVDKDVISTDKGGYLTPTKPAEADNKKDETDVLNESKSIQNDGYLNSINASIDDEVHSVESSESKDINISSFQGNLSVPVLTGQIDEENDQSYIYPIDPDNPSLPISYGYHTWDGTEDASNQDTTDTEV